jgi:outer membrane protein assembly factor BamB
MPFKTRLLLVAALVAAPLTAFAQPATQPAMPRGGLNPDSFYGKETFQGVSVRDSLEAIKKLEDARRMERLEDWNKAADWYQEVLEKYGQYVVPNGTDANNNIRQYTGIERPVQEQLAKWPKPGLDAYRNRYGAVAATMLESARQDDRETLAKVMKLYFVTEAGKQAGIRLLDLLLEFGEFPEAARVGDRLLDWHPNLQAERAQVLFRTALAYHLSGDDAKSKERTDQLRAKFGNTVGSLFGRDVVLADALDRLRQNPPPVSIATATGSVWYNPGGDASRSLVPGSMGRPGARLAYVDYVPPPANRSNVPNMAMEVEGRPVNRSGADLGNLGVMPVADDGQLYFQDGSRLYAVSIQSGVPLPGWSQTYPNSNGQYAVNSFGYSRNQQHTVTLTDNAVLAVMGYPERMAQFGAANTWGNDKGTRLVCLDRATGRERWPAARPRMIPEENLRALDFSGSPLVVADNVYILGRGGKNTTAEDCYVLCFDLNSGAYKWSCFIASSNNAYAFNGMGIAANTDTLSHLAYSSGRVYVLTNVGAAAAIDAYSGTISWLNIYPRDESAMMNPNMGRWGGMQRTNTGVKPWEFNPVIVQEGKVFLLPTDSKNLLVYDAGSGAELKRISIAEIRDELKSDPAQSGDGSLPTALIGVDGRQAFLTGGTSFYCIDWTRPKGMIEYQCSFPSAIRGRGFVTTDSVFLCTESSTLRGAPSPGGLFRINRKNGKRVDRYPAENKDWDEGEGPGNLLVIADQVIVASAKRLSVYADLKLARERLDNDVIAAPTDPEPRLRYAEVMFVAGKLPVAMEKLDETVKLLGTLQNMRPGPERDHLFNDCITFAGKLQRDLKPETMERDLPAVIRLYDLAAAAADSPSQQVNYRMSRARFNTTIVQEDSLTEAVRLYQEILSTAKLRPVPLIDDAPGGSGPGGMVPAADVAERMITQVKKNKPSAYEAFEKLADEALAAAGDDAALLRAVAEQYPNSSSAPKAMIKSAEAFEAQANYREAAHTLRQVFSKYGESADRAKVLQDMARNYLAMKETASSDRPGTAAARLAAAVRLGAGSATLTKPLKLPGEKVIAPAGATIDDALGAVRNYKAATASATLPDFHILPAATEKEAEAARAAYKAWKDAGADPASKPRQREPFMPIEQLGGFVIPNVNALVKPPLELRQQFARPDRVVAWSNGSLQIIPVGSINPVGQSADLAGQPRNLAWLDNGASLLVWSDDELLLLDGSNATRKWSLALRQLPKVEVVSSGQAEETVQSNATNPNEGEVFINGGQQVIIRGGVRRVINGRLIVGGGAAFIQPGVQPGPMAPIGGRETITQVRPVDDKLIVATSAGQLFALKMATGTPAWHTRLSAAAPISRVAATDDFTVARVDDPATTQLVVIDTLTGQLVRRIGFNTESGAVPVNFALAADGTLVWIQPDRLCGKDLFDPPTKKENNYDIVAGQNEGARGAGPNAQIQLQMDGGQVFNPIYAGATNPDQLLISEGRILVVNSNGKYVSVHSLETGKLIVNTQEDGRRAEARLATAMGENNEAVNDWGVAMTVVGSKLYVTSRRNGPVCYNLDKTNLLWNGTIDKPTTPNVNFQEPFIGQDYFVLLDRPAPKAGPQAGAGPGLPGGPPIPPVPGAFVPAAVAAAPPANPMTNTARLHCYTRAVFDKTGRESGKINYYPYLRDDSGIGEVQAVEGGFYYLTGDKKLHFLKGARPQ